MKGVITYIKSGKYPPSTSENEKRRIRKLAKSFIIEDGKLYRYKKSKLGDISKKLFIKDEKEKFKILKEYHDNNEHRGVVAVLKLVGSRYYWPEWTVFVRNYCLSCKQCEKRRKSLQGHSGTQTVAGVNRCPENANTQNIQQVPQMCIKQEPDIENG